MNIFPVFFAAAKIGIGRGQFYFAKTKIRIGRGPLLRLVGCGRDRCPTTSLQAKLFFL